MSAEQLRQVSQLQAVEVDVRAAPETWAAIGKSCGQALSWTQQGLKCLSPTFSWMDVTSKNVNDPFRKFSGSTGNVCSHYSTDFVWLKKVGGEWLTEKITHPQVDVSLKEDANFPPELYYRREGGRARLLLNLNPQLQHIKLAREKTVTWEWTKGRSISGGLYYPINYQPGRRYPLVIQTHGFYPGNFAFWGSFSTSNAAEPLAGRGMFVLQLNDIYASGILFNKPAEWQRFEAERAIKIYKSAIAYLSKRGLVDPERVGIIGFSHTCFFVDWALTRYPKLFAAASVTEGGGDGGYTQYMLNVTNSIQDSALYSGPPYGQNLMSWVRWSPIFNIQRARTPLLIMVAHNRLALADWEWLDGLRDLRKPVYMVVLDGRANDEHALQEPWDISVASGTNVDWFDFWLNHHEDRSHSVAWKAAQYEQWRHLRSLYRKSKDQVSSWEYVEDSTE